MTDTFPQGAPMPDPAPQETPPVHEELKQLRRAVEDLTRVQQTAEPANRNRVFLAGFAGSTFGRIVGTIIEKVLEINDWFGFLG
ncbi:hypothetical protein [Nocardia fluminea]|uniref:hypothetical protein n=1 Tax=Nocardia fluminea TaxID=134984 RepID=UPI003D0EEAB8